MIASLSCFLGVIYRRGTWRCVIASPDRVDLAIFISGQQSNMPNGHACYILGLLFVCSLQSSLVAAQAASAPSPSSTVSQQDVSHFDASKYALPVPAKNAAASSEAGNQTASLAAIATASAESPSEQPKYILPVPSQVPAPQGAKTESAVSVPSAPLSKGSAAAKIEAVSGFVTRQGQNFVLNGKTVYFAGTNAW